MTSWRWVRLNMQLMSAVYQLRWSHEAAFFSPLMFLCVSCTELHTSVQLSCPVCTAGRLAPRAAPPDQTVPVQTPHPPAPHLTLRSLLHSLAPPHPASGRRRLPGGATSFRRESEAEVALKWTGVKLRLVGKMIFIVNICGRGRNSESQLDADLHVLLHSVSILVQ